MTEYKLTELREISARFGDFEPVPDEIVNEYEREQRRRVIDSRIKFSRIPFDYSGKFIDFETKTPEQGRLLNAVQLCFNRFLNGQNVTICLLGGYGIGKTKLSCAFLLEAVEHDKQMQFGEKTPFSIRYALCDEIREEYDSARSFNAKTTQEQIIKDYISFDVLVLDEIGRSSDPRTEKEIIYRLVNGRDLAKKTTILISNMNLQEFAQHLGGATMDRLKNSAVFPDCRGLMSYRGRK